MAMFEAGQEDLQITLRPVDASTWREVAALEVLDSQRAFVAAPTYYLALCSYGGLWQPLAISVGERIVGFMMWAIDRADGSCWLGGILVDHRVQRRGYGTRAVRVAMDLLTREHGCREFALSYQPGNVAAASAYAKLGFVETGESEDDEVVARLTRR